MKIIMSENLKLGTALRWRESLIIAIVVLVLFYIIPSVARYYITHWNMKILSILFSDVIGSIVVGFITNNYRMAIILYVFCSIFEIILMEFDFNIMANLIGDLFPALVLMYFARKLYLNLGN